ncbi:MAG: 3-keto-disaccharide hydrolase [Adhaeribacter sp.]
MHLIKGYLFIYAFVLAGLAGGCRPAEQVSDTHQGGGVALQINAKSENQNQLTTAEKSAGWKLLFDGKTAAGWRGVGKDAFPSGGWKIENGELIILKTNSGDARKGGDIVTTEQFSDFELTLEAKLTPGANSGLKYFVIEQKGSALGLEFQILDDDRHPDAKMGKNGNRTIGSLYDLIPAQNKQAKPIGAWNQIRLVAKNKHVEHWLNGTKVVEYERGSPEFRQLVAESKYKKYENFGEAAQGPILLQDHSDEVHFRNIKIRTL